MNYDFDPFLLSKYPCNIHKIQLQYKLYKINLALTQIELYAHIAYQETLTRYLGIERIRRQRKEDYLKRLLGYSCI